MGPAPQEQRPHEDLDARRARELRDFQQRQFDAREGPAFAAPAVPYKLTIFFFLRKKLFSHFLLSLSPIHGSYLLAIVGLSIKAAR